MDISGPVGDHQSEPWLRVNSLDELMKSEKDILECIDRMPNGGYLFLIHPFILFRDIGVELSDQAEREVRELEPRLTALSPVPYNALKHAKEKQNVRFHLRGLFRRS